MYEIQSNPPFCRLFSISFDLIRKLLSQNPSTFNTYTKCLKLFFFSVSFTKINPKKAKKAKKKPEIENKTKNKRNFNKQELIKRKNNCFYQLLSAFSDAKQTRSFTDSHINVLACKQKNALYTEKKTAHFQCSIVSRGLGRATEWIRNSEMRMSENNHEALNSWELRFVFSSFEAWNTELIHILWNEYGMSGILNWLLAKSIALSF